MMSVAFIAIQQCLLMPKNAEVIDLIKKNMRAHSILYTLYEQNIGFLGASLKMKNYRRLQ